MNKTSPQNILNKGIFPLLSVIMPVYNGEKYIAEAIDSILAQTFNDFEFIIIDDGSTDGSLKVLRKYELIDTRVLVITHENRGLPNALNEAIKIARGKWIARMDQDDIALPNRLLFQLAWLDETGADIAGCWVKRFGTYDKRIVRLPQNDETIKTELLFRSPFAHPAVIMRKHLIEQLLYDALWDKAEDYDLWVRAAESGLIMTNMPQVLLLYRVHEAQISTASFSKQQQLSKKIQQRYCQYFFNKFHLSPEWLNAGLRIFNSSGNKLNLDDIDLFIQELLLHANVDSKELIWRNAQRLYYECAYDNPDVVKRWSKLTSTSSRTSDFSTKFKLWILCRFGIRQDSFCFLFVRKLIISIS